MRAIEPISISTGVIFSEPSTPLPIAAMRKHATAAKIPMGSQISGRGRHARRQRAITPRDHGAEYGKHRSCYTLRRGCFAWDAGKNPIMNDAPPRFPALEGKTLTDEIRVLPRDFAGAMNIVVVGFAKEQIGEVMSWVPLIEKYVTGRPDVRAFLIVALSGGMKMMSRVIVPAMRAAVPQEARSSTIVAFLDLARLKANLAITSEKELAVFVVDAGGNVVWRTAGAFDHAKGAALEGALTA